jgi:ABC-type Fe3+-siderophore transport system permease subunit
MPAKSPTTRLVETMGVAVAAYLAAFVIAVLIGAAGLSVHPLIGVILGLGAVFLVLSVAHYRRAASESA